MKTRIYIYHWQWYRINFFFCYPKTIWAIIKYKIILYDESETEHFIQKVFSIRHKIVMSQLLSCRAKLWLKFWFFYIKLSLWRLGTEGRDQTTRPRATWIIFQDLTQVYKIGRCLFYQIETFIVYFNFVIPR